MARTISEREDIPVMQDLTCRCHLAIGCEHLARCLVGQNIFDLSAADGLGRKPHAGFMSRVHLLDDEVPVRGHPDDEQGIWSVLEIRPIERVSLPPSFFSLAQLNSARLDAGLKRGRQQA